MSTVVIGLAIGAICAAFGWATAPYHVAFYEALFNIEPEKDLYL